MFPELKILHSHLPTADNSLYRCKLDWSLVDSQKIKRSKEWILQFLLEDRTEEENKFLISYLDTVSWSGELYPIQFDNLFSYHNSFLLPKKYYDEVIRLEKLANSEYRNYKNFDYTVREKCQSITIELVNIYFYLIHDAIYTWNSFEQNSEIFETLKYVSLYRFWKKQLGNDLIINRVLKDLDSDSDLYQRLKLAFEDCNQYSVVPFRNESELRSLIRTHMRDDRIESLLTKNKKSS